MNSYGLTSLENIQNTPVTVNCTQSCGSKFMTSNQSFVAPPQLQCTTQAFQAAPAFLC
jgi:hypothetical protein